MNEATTITSAVEDLSALPLIARGKVREIYDLNNSELLFVATDRISAYDVVLDSVRVSAVVNDLSLCK